MSILTSPILLGTDIAKIFSLIHKPYANGLFSLIYQELCQSLKNIHIIKPANFLENTGIYRKVSNDPKAMPILRESELSLIQKVLEITNGKKVPAARLLGIDKATFYRKIKKYDMAAKLRSLLQS